MNQPRIHKVAIRIFSICLLSSTTIYSANNESKKPESNVPQLQYLIVKNLVKNKVPLEVAAPALNNNLHLKDPYTQESTQLGDWHDIKKINEEYTKLRKEIYCHRKPLNSQNARIIFFPGGPWDNEHNKKYKSCLFYCIDNGCCPFCAQESDFLRCCPPLTGIIFSILATTGYFYLRTNECTLKPEDEFAILLFICIYPWALCTLCSVVLPTPGASRYKTFLKKLTTPKTWQSSTAPQNLTMSEGVDVNESSNFAASSNILNAALKMKED